MRGSSCADQSAADPDGRTRGPWAAPILLIFAPTLMVLLQLALSRSREYDADAGAAQLTRDPLGRASALLKLERRNAGLWQRIMVPRRGTPEPSILRTHPATGEPVARLRELAADQAPAFQDDGFAPPAFGQSDRAAARSVCRSVVLSGVAGTEHAGPGSFPRSGQERCSRRSSRNLLVQLCAASSEIGVLSIPPGRSRRKSGGRDRPDLH